MMGERPKMTELGIVVLFLLGGLSNVWGADGVDATPTTGETTAIESEFQKVYDDLVKMDPSAAELMKQEFEAYGRGDLEVPHMDPEEAKKEFDKAYQELVSSGENDEAQKLKENFDKFQEWEKGGQIGSPPIDFERVGESYDHMSEEAKAELAEKWGGTAHDSFEVPAPGETSLDRSTGESTFPESDKAIEYERPMQDYGGMEQERSEQSTAEVERTETESTREMTVEHETDSDRQIESERETTYEREYQYDMPEKGQEYQPQ
jgi:hypothetical protein